jgi:hypothetical protein
MMQIEQIDLVGQLGAVERAFLHNRYVETARIRVHGARRAMNDELRVREQLLEKRFAGNVMLVLPDRCPAERQRVAFEATEPELST